MAFEHYIRSGSKMLRCGYTTGTCAALAASAAASCLLEGKVPESVSIMTAKGIEVALPVSHSGKENGKVWCAVEKDAGDDADVTHGILVKADVELCSEPGIHIDGGEGIGRVTMPGLDQPVGNAAINSVPRRMIEEAVGEVCTVNGYNGGIDVVISIPGGEKIAQQTFNPMLGVEGGLSILGTSGIVEPMSQQALTDTIEVSIRQASGLSKKLILTPGNYGENFIADNEIDKLGVPVVKCSNFIGDALDMASAEEFDEVILIGHIGKIVKLAGGIMNTHSRYADCRQEIFCAHTALQGGSTEICTKIMTSASTDACIGILKEEHLWDPVRDSILQAIQIHLEHRVHDAYRIGAVVFSNQYGILGCTGMAEEILEQWKIEDNGDI